MTLILSINHVSWCRDNRDRRIAREKKFSEEWSKAVGFLVEKGVLEKSLAPLNAALPSSSSSSSSSSFLVPFSTVGSSSWSSSSLSSASLRKTYINEVASCNTEAALSLGDSADRAEPSSSLSTSSQTVSGNITSQLFLSPNTLDHGLTPEG